MQFTESEINYLKLLSRSFPTERAVASEIINLNAILNLPKGTEHFVSDIHGEYEAFYHILRHCSGTIRMRIDETFPELWESERRKLATLIYYPKEKLEIMKAEADDLAEFYDITLRRLIKFVKRVSFKYTRSYVRKRLPKDYAYIIEELLYGESDDPSGRIDHRKDIIDSIIEAGAADDFIIELCDVITKLAVFRLHIVGDIFDRGAGGDQVLNALMNHHSVDIQWGNHDILWMGAAAGNRACIANVIRICTRYDNLHTLEVGYGISLRPLVTFALKTYADDPCTDFKAAVSIMDAMHDTDMESLRKIGKAISIIQFKLEGQLISAHPNYNMDDQMLLGNIDLEKQTVTVLGKEYKLETCNFPTLDPKDPYKLTEEEQAVIDRLEQAFKESRILQEHIRFLFAKGSLYKVVNGNVLFHAIMPMTEDGEFDYVNTLDGPKKGKEWFDYCERLVRTGYFGGKSSKDKARGIDLFWYLWCGYKSPLFGKKRITTFERMYIADEETHKEPSNPYYAKMEDPAVVEKILAELGGDPENGIIINGHVPVKKGRTPVHAGGRAFIIDGGFAKAYQKTTGIAGYSLVQNSWGFILSAHQPFVSKQMAVEEELDILSTQVAKESVDRRMYNRDTDDGRLLQRQIDDLKRLMEAYREGIISQGK